MSNNLICHTFYISSFTDFYEMVVMAQRRKLRLREGEPPAHGVTVSLWKSFDLNPAHGGSHVSHASPAELELLQWALDKHLQVGLGLNGCPVPVLPLTGW